MTTLYYNVLITMQYVYNILHITLQYSHYDATHVSHFTYCIITCIEKCAYYITTLHYNDATCVSYFTYYTTKFSL